WSEGCVCVVCSVCIRVETTERECDCVCPSQVLPVDANECLVGLLGVADLLGDAVLAPQLLELSVALPTEMECVPSPGQTHTHTNTNAHTQKHTHTHTLTHTHTDTHTDI